MRLTHHEGRATLKFVKSSAFIYPFIFLLALAAALQPGMVSAQDAVQVTTIGPSIFIQSPREGQALQGIEIIEGKIRGDGFVSGKISFRYAAEGKETWFYLTDLSSEQASFNVEWDTSQITDGNYHLRVVAEYESSPKIFESINNLRIRNHSQVETSTPAPETTQQASAASLTPTRQSTPAPTPTPLPKNPAEIETTDLIRVLIISGAVILLAFLTGGIYNLVRKNFR